MSLLFYRACFRTIKNKNEKMMIVPYIIFCFYCSMKVYKIHTVQDVHTNNHDYFESFEKTTTDLINVLLEYKLVAHKLLFVAL